MGATSGATAISISKPSTPRPSSPSWRATAAGPPRRQRPTPAPKRSQTRGAYDTDGTFEGSAQGYGGTVTCRVTIENGYIESVEVTDHAGETPAYFAQAEGLTQTICDAQGTNVDTVSGATFSSAGILNAVNAALEQSNAGGTQ